jgi:DNA repair protein RecO (recombination protein O)
VPSSHLYRDHGIVLRTYRLGEADRIVVLMTRDHGKVRAVAKGVRKTKSKFGARLEPMSHIAVQFHEGRELDIVTQTESVDHFRPIRDDLDRIARASAMLEAVDQMALEREPNVRLYQMLLGALRSLAGHNGPLVVPAFFWKLLALEGLRPVLERCAACDAVPADRPSGGEREAVALVAFDLESGGTLCASCRRGRALSPAALALMQQILGGRLGAALNEPPSPATHEVEHLATDAMEHHLERRLRSVSLLDRA